MLGFTLPNGERSRLLQQSWFPAVSYWRILQPATSPVLARQWRSLELCLGYPKSWPVILPFRTPELLQNPGDPEPLGTRMPSIHPFHRPWATRAYQASDAMDQPDHLDSLLSGGDPPSTHARHDLILWLQSGESHSQFGSAYPENCL